MELGDRDKFGDDNSKLRFKVEVPEEDMCLLLLLAGLAGVVNSKETEGGGQELGRLKISGF